MVQDHKILMVKDHMVQEYIIGPKSHKSTEMLCCMELLYAN